MPIEGLLRSGLSILRHGQSIGEKRESDEGKTVPRQHLIIAAACTLALALLVGLGWSSGLLTPRSQALPGGTFSLVDQDGRVVSQDVLKGRWSVVFFGFTYCPDVCPTTLQSLALAREQLGPRAKDLQVVFISVDPQRDRPAQLKAYLADPAFPKGTIGLTGTPDQVAAAARAYRVYFRKSGEGEAYLVDHSTAAYLMDPRGRFDRILPFGITPDEAARQIAEAMRS